MARQFSPGCGSVWYCQSILVFCRYLERPGMSDMMVSSDPASRSRTDQLEISDNRLATTAPADPAPMTMKSYSAYSFWGGESESIKASIRIGIIRYFDRNYFGIFDSSFRVEGGSVTNVQSGEDHQVEHPSPHHQSRCCVGGHLHLFMSCFCICKRV